MTSVAASLELLSRAGRRDEALAELAKLHQKLEASGFAEDVGQAFLDAASELGEGDRALTAARRLSAEHPENPHFLRVIARESFQRHDLATATRAIERAVQLSEKQFVPRRHAVILRLRATILFGEDRRGSWESALAAYLIDKDQEVLLQFVQREPETFTPALLDVSFETLQVPESDRRDIRRVLAAARNPPDTVMATLGAHLRQMVTRVNAAGSQAVLLSYPFASQTNGVARQVAAETGAGWIDLEAEFGSRLKTVRREDLFVADGHLNDAGYAIVGELVANDLKNRLPTAQASRDSKPRQLFEVRAMGTSRLISAGSADASGQIAAQWPIVRRRP